MEEATAPRFHGLETHTGKVCVAALFPIAPRIRVTIKCQHQWAYRVFETRPCFRPPFWRQAHPRRRASELALDVGLLGISLLNGVVLEDAESICSLCGRHGGRGRAQIIEHCVVEVLVSALIALKDNAALVFPPRIALRQL